MADVPGPPEQRPTRADRLRRLREGRAEQTGPYQRGRTLFLAAALGVLGLFLLLGAVLAFTPWSLAGAVLVLGSVGPLLLADRHRVETIGSEDRPAHRRELGWYLLCLALAAAGLVLAVHPW